MDSEDSRPGSSASNSSSNSSSRASSPTELVAQEGPKSPGAESIGSAVSETDGTMQATARSRSHSFEGQRSPRSPSESSSSGASSDNELNATNIEAASRGSSRHGSIASAPQSPTQSPISAVSRSQSPLSRPQTPLSSVEQVRAISRNSISHEDLSDVSDMESEKIDSLENTSNFMDDGEASRPTEVDNYSPKTNNYADEHKEQDGNVTDLRQRLEQKKSHAKLSESNGHQNGKSESFEELVRTHDEDALDFEAEEGECPDLNKDDEKDNKEAASLDKKKDDSKKSDAEEGEELEEGEVSDEDEKRPEENEPKPVCRFYTRGQCTWGMSCRFLHPGVTDKGNYTMFDMMPPVAVPPNAARRDPYLHGPDYRDYRSERPPLHHRPILPHAAAAPSAYGAHAPDARALLTEAPVVVESAWERGLRTAKEMMRKANKRKEQDSDFDEKKMNMTLSADELEKDPYYIKERSPPDVSISFSSFSI